MREAEGEICPPSFFSGIPNTTHISPFYRVGTGSGSSVLGHRTVADAI